MCSSDLLRVEFAGLAEVVDPVEKPQARRMAGRHLGELVLDGQPDRHRVDPHRLSGDACHEDVWTMDVLDRPPKNGWDLQTTFVIDSRLGASAQA